VTLTMDDGRDPFDGIPRVRRSDVPEAEDIRIARRLERKELRTLAETRGATPDVLAFIDELIEERSKWDAEGMPW
jgi:hypothetical protein